MHLHQGRPTGWIEVVCGPMFSGKTEELIRRVRLAQIARQRIQIFKHSSDQRYRDTETFLASHSAQTFKCQPVLSADELFDAVQDQTRVVGVDEAQFFDEPIVGVCQKLAERGMRVLVAGLDQDYRGEPFGPMPRLLAVAEFVTKSQAVCMSCGGLGTKSQRITRQDGQIVVGATEVYEARCRSCFDPDFTLAGELSKVSHG